MNIEGSVALVTGANRGLGKVLVEQLRACGAKKIYAGARDPSKVAHSGVEPVKLDITSAADVEAAAKALSDVTLVINNAGVASFSSLADDGSLEIARKAMETNYFGTLRVANAFAPILAKNGGGALVNMLSVLTWITYPSLAAYCASKSAAWALTNALRQELKAQGTLVVGVHAGLIDTDMAAGVEAPKVTPEQVAKAILDGVAAGHEEVLSDDPSRHIKAALSNQPGPYL
ncbi:MAG: SDR family oxidoreductase [Methylovirgula sp.]|uniref:SDR family oxidoreductase n=1 Tax=Methylovirgula sp. TaxID=1978224 RepID=UPI002F18D957